MVSDVALLLHCCCIVGALLLHCYIVYLLLALFSKHLRQPQVCSGRGRELKFRSASLSDLSSFIRFSANLLEDMAIYNALLACMRIRLT